MREFFITYWWVGPLVMYLWYNSCTIKWYREANTPLQREWIDQFLLLFFGWFIMAAMVIWDTNWSKIFRLLKKPFK